MANVTVSINEHMLDNPDFVKYLDVHIGNILYWNYQVKYVTLKCCQHIGFLEILLHLPYYVVVLYCFYLFVFLLLFNVLVSQLLSG